MNTAVILYFLTLYFLLFPLFLKKAADCKRYLRINLFYGRSCFPLYILSTYISISVQWEWITSWYYDSHLDWQNPHDVDNFSDWTTKNRHSFFGKLLPKMLRSFWSPCRTNHLLSKTVSSLVNSSISLCKAQSKNGRLRLRSKKTMAVSWSHV